MGFEKFDGLITQRQAAHVHAPEPRKDSDMDARSAARLAVALACGLALAITTIALAQDSTSDLGIAIPAGTITAYAAAEAPTGWLIADGSEVSRTAHPALFAAVGTRYGAGNGSTTFNLPDLRGRVAVGRGTNAQVDELNENDGLAVAARKIRHRHGTGSLAAAGGFHGHGVSDPGHRHHSGGQAFVVDLGNGAAYDLPTARDYGPDRYQFKAYYENASRTTGISVNGSSHSHPNSDFNGEIGDTSGPLNTPAHITLNYIIKD